MIDQEQQSRTFRRDGGTPTPFGTEKQSPMIGEHRRGSVWINEAMHAMNGSPCA